MREEALRSLLLVDADADERRLMSAVASRAGWSVVGAACAETALGLLQGPHGREVRAALLSSWDADTGPALIAALRASAPDLAGHRACRRRLDRRRGRGDARRRDRFPGPSPVAPERLLEALERQRRPPPRRRRACAACRKSSRPSSRSSELVGAAPDFRAALAVAAKAARNRLPILIIGEPGTGKETFARGNPRRQPARQGPAGRRRLQGGRRQHHRQRTCSAMKPAPSPAPSPSKIGKLVEADGGTLAARRNRRAAGRNPGAARPRARHRRSAPGRLQRLQFGRRPHHRHGEPRRCPTISTRSWPSGCRRPPSPSRRCATAAATFPRSPATCSARFAEQPGMRRCRSATTRWRC